MDGAEVLKQFEIALDISRSISNREFTVVEGDTGNVLHITLTDDGVPVNLAGCRVLAIFSKSTGTSSQDSGVEDGGVSIGGAERNEVTITLFNTSFAPGMVECELQVYSGGALATLVTSAKFNFTCRRGILNDETVQATSEYPLLVTLMAQAAQAVETAEAAADAAYAAAAATGQAAHAARHATGGEDPVSPASIGAAATSHAHGSLTHDGKLGTAANKAVYTGTGGALQAGTLPVAAGGTGAATAAGALAALGAQSVRLTFTEKTVATSAWTADSTYADYPYRAAVACAGVTANSFVDVVLGPEDAAGGNFAPVCASHTDGVYLYAKAVPDATLTIPTIVVWR